MWLVRGPNVVHKCYPLNKTFLKAFGSINIEMMFTGSSFAVTQSTFAMAKRRRSVSTRKWSWISVFNWRSTYTSWLLKLRSIRPRWIFILNAIFIKCDAWNHLWKNCTKFLGSVDISISNVQNFVCTHKSCRLARFSTAFISLPSNPWIHYSIKETERQIPFICEVVMKEKQKDKYLSFDSFLQMKQKETTGAGYV